MNGEQCGSILIVDDEAHIREMCSRVAAKLGLEWDTAGNGEEAMSRLAERQFDIVLTDVRMPRKDGYELFRDVAEKFPGTMVIMMTAYGTIEQAVGAIKKGVFDYIPKPFSLKRLRDVINESLKWRESREGMARREDFKGGMFHGIVGRSPEMLDVYERIARAAAVDSTVLIQGESGTGKELVARAVHEASPRSNGPFLAVACNALSESLVESELFGHVKGAFTGAQGSRSGILRAAEHGTVFLDEIGEVPLPAQAKFLRALQQKEVRPVGSSKSESFDARIIAATNRDLEERVVEGTFRKDLFYRLHVIPIHLPPLRERREDIPLLVEYFLVHRAGESGRRLEITDDAMKMLTAHEWPGNIRQLENLIEQAYVFCTSPVVTTDELARLLSSPRRREDAQPAQDDDGKLLAAREKEAIRDALEKTGYNKTMAAKVLGISRATLYAKIQKYKLTQPERQG